MRIFFSNLCFTENCKKFSTLRKELMMIIIIMILCMVRINRARIVANIFRVLTRNLWKMMFLRHLGKSVKLKAYARTVRCVKRRWGSGFFYLGFFEKIYER